MEDFAYFIRIALVFLFFFMEKLSNFVMMYFANLIMKGKICLILWWTILHFYNKDVFWT